MYLKTVLPLVAASMVLTACGGGGSNGTASSAQPQSAAYGSLTFTTSQAVIASNLRKPRYVSPSTKHATLIVDQTTGFQVSCTTGSTTTGTCTIPWTSTSGSHNFAVEIDDSTWALAEAQANYVLTPGPNTLAPLVLNAVAANAVFAIPTCSNNTNSCSGTYAIVDVDGDMIVAPGTFDNAPIQMLSSATSVGTISASSLSAPDSLGNDYTYTAACVAAASGTFAPTFSTGTGNHGFSPTFLGDLSLRYPSAQNDTQFFGGTTGFGLIFTCTNGAISANSSGNLNVQNAGRK